MEPKKNYYTITQIYILFIAIELILYWLNADKYFQISGFWSPLVLATFIGVLLIAEKIHSGKCNISHAGIICFLLLVWIILLSTTRYRILNRGYFLSYVLLIFNVLLLDLIDVKHRDYKLLSYAYIASAFIISIIIIVFQTRYYITDASRLTIQIQSNNKIDPNYLATFLCAPVLICLDFLIGEKNVIKRILGYFVCFTIVIGIALTGSRGAIVAMITGLIIMFANRIKIMLRSPQILYFLPVTFFSIIAVYLFIPSTTFARLTNVSTWISDGSNTRRFFLWGNAYKAIKSSPFCGLGICDTSEIIGKITGYYEPSHNTYLEIWLHIGVIGIALFLALLLIVFFKSDNNASKAIIGLTMMFSIFISTEVTLALWINIAFSILISKIKEKKNG